MSDETTADPGAQTPADMPTTATQPERDDLHDFERAKQLRAENKGLRARAKGAEDQLTSLQARVESMQRDEITRIAGDYLRDGTDIFTGGASVADFLDDDGDVDRDVVGASTAELVAERPHWAKGYAGDKPPTDRPIEGLKPGATPTGYTPPGLSWRDVIGHARDPRERNI